nr:hypothetical protein [Longimicrobium terrae]
MVFSTGPAIPATAASGVVTERVTGSAARVRVDAVRVTDSLTYTTQTDTSGAFRFAQVPEGEYRVTAYRDANRNNRTDVFEARDTTRFTLVAGSTPTARLAILLPDSTAPRPGSASSTADGAGWIEVRFDDYLDPAQTVTPAQITLIGPDSLPVAVAEARIGPAPTAVRDSAGADSAGGRAQADTARRTTAPRPGAGAGRPARADSVRADTTPAAPLPSQVLSIRPVQPLPANTQFRVRVTGVRNINGLVGGGDIPLRTPRPAPAPAATTPRPAAPAGDSARAPVVGEPSAPQPAAPVPAVPAPAPSTPPRPSSGAPAVVPPRTPSASRSSSSGF